MKKINKFKLKVFFLHSFKFYFSFFFLLYKKMNVMFGSWKVLRKKNIKDNDFLLFDFIMKNIKEAYKKIIYLF